MTEKQPQLFKRKQLSKKYFIKAQPDDTSCGPACLYSLYRNLGEKISFDRVSQSVQQFAEGGGTLAVVLGIDALKRGFGAELHILNLNIFDPTWFDLSSLQVTEKLEARLRLKKNRKKDRFVIEQYIRFIKNGGTLRFGEVTPYTLKRYLKRSSPLLVGLSATWLYQCKRENPINNVSDDVGGEPAGHFVLAYRYDRKKRGILIGDPYLENPSGDHLYHVSIGRFISSLYLGVYTYDANILMVSNKETKR